MFFLDKEAAAGSALESGVVENIFVWRYIPSHKYKIDKDGDIVAKGSAFSIRRWPDGTVREPSASLFQIRDKCECSLESSVFFLQYLHSFKGFSRMGETDASGSISVGDVAELNKDPKAFALNVSEKQKENDDLIHWDLRYVSDDREKEIQDAKNALALICKVYVSGAMVLQVER